MKVAASARSIRLRTLGIVRALLAVVLLGTGINALRHSRSDTYRITTITSAGMSNLAVETKVAHRIVEFRGDLLDGGRSWTSTSERGSVVVLNFWASWCAPCRQEQPELSKVARAYETRGVRFIGINIEDSRAGANRYRQEFDVPYPSVFDPAGRNTGMTGVIGLPTTVILDRDGRAAYQLLGRTTVAILSQRLDKLLANGGRRAAG